MLLQFIFCRDDSTNNTQTDVSRLINAILANHTQQVDMSDAYTVIFDAPGQATIITLYVLILILGILFNAAIIWVILSKFFFVQHYAPETFKM